jgi:hypothetical protein
MNLIESLQHHFGYTPLQKIDPVTLEPKQEGTEPNEQRFSQAAIPVILTGMRLFTGTDEGAEEILKAPDATDWVSRLFAGRAEEIIEKVAAYGGFGIDHTHTQLNEIAAQAAYFIQETVAPSNKIMDVKNLMEGQISQVLTYLPPSLQLGVLLNDDTIDDRTNKMEGPASSLINAIGAVFTNADEDIKKEKL